MILVASIIFYAYGDLRFLPFLLGSICLNYAIAWLYTKRNISYVIYIGIIANIGLIAYFKYKEFFLQNIHTLIGQDYTPLPFVLPLGISFFTFQQIAYLVDIKRKQADLYNFRTYSAFVMFFPQLIAGPIVRHNEIIPQFHKPIIRPGLYRRLSQGIMFFIIGLLKKFLIADKMAEHANLVFDQSLTQTIHSSDAWSGSLAYTFQIYFDFSSYSDMALGLALICGLSLPFNFDSPYKAKSIREFWHRWHMTLSRFLRDYLYIPMGGNRSGHVRQLMNGLACMSLCGLWHGAAWNFVFWGIYHGVGLVINNMWSFMRLPKLHVIGWLLTILFVVFGWVLFRAENMASLNHMIHSMLFLSDHTGAYITTEKIVKLLAISSFIVLLLPNSQNLVLKHIKPSRFLACIMAIITIVIVLELGKGQPQEFIYFVF